MIENDNSTCLICTSNEYKVIFSFNEPDQYENAVGVEREGYWRRWIQCRNCGFYYSESSISDVTINKIYTLAYHAVSSPWRTAKTDEMFEHIISLPPHESETKYRVAWIKSQLKTLWSSNMISHTKPPYRLLDIGGATGVLAYEFRDEEWMPHVIDPSEEGEFLQTKYGIPYVKDFYKPGYFDAPFDLITMNRVIEHIREPISFLKLMREDMKADSLIFIEVPDAAYFKYELPENDIFNSCHFWMFAPNTIVQLLDRCGFEVFSMLRTRTVRGAYILMLIGGLK